MKVLETEIDFDFYDAKQMENFETNIESMKEKINQINPEEMKQSEFINEFCSIIEEGFDKIFGADTSKKIFEGKRNFKLCVQVFRDLVKARQKQEKEVNDEIKILQNEIQAISYDYSMERIK